MENLTGRAKKLGISLSERQGQQFQLYYAELVSWNRKVNLTTLLQPEEVEVKHFLDSLTLLPVIEGLGTQQGRWLDVGSGAGFPGLPLKIACPQMGLTLIDSVGKKTAFLAHLVQALQLNDVEVITGRAEELAHRPELRETFDGVMARALAKLNVISELALPFCRVGGVLIAQKKGDISRELNQAHSAISAMGGELKEVQPITAEGLEDNRTLVIIQKVAHSQDKYPRRAGIPAKRPL